MKEYRYIVELPFGVQTEVTVHADSKSDARYLLKREVESRQGENISDFESWHTWLIEVKDSKES